MTDLEKIAAILASNLSDMLKLELVGLLASNPQYVVYPVYPTYPSWPTYPVYPTWTCGEGNTATPLPETSRTVC
jgi:hypothetical protein